MAYRHLKRVLGETSLQRKCRLLFGTCLFLLISGAFVWVDKIVEEQVFKTNRQKAETARQTARSFATMGLLKLHFINWVNVSDEQNSATRPYMVESDKGELIRKMIGDLESQDYQHAVLSEEKLQGTVAIQEHELPYIKQLKEKHAERQRAVAKRALETARAKAAGEDAKAAPADDGEKAPDDKKADAKEEPPGGFLSAFLPDPLQEPADDFADPVSVDYLTKDSDGKQYYAYYQMVEWKNTCTHCHPKPAGSGAVSAAESGMLEQQDPLRVVRVIVPHEWEQQSAVHRIRAILTSASILTFFVAMIALYVIVRYVVVKPLQHLRDVSDEISRGATDLRAEIQTNDEFEDLADSFNRMLRHLTETQANLRGVNKDLDAKVDELAQLNMRLYEMNRLKSDFLANMSHELRTPLNSIIGFSEVLTGIDSLTEKQKRYANNIQNSGRVLLEMINDILDLAKVESGKMELRPTEFRVDSIVRAQCDMVRALTEDKNIDLLVDVDEGLEPIYQDQSKIQQILTNLLSNAIKFTPEGGRIDVRAERLEDGRLQLAVSDTGVGIPNEDREIIFEKFRQSETVLGADGLTREYSGTGLGLSIVKELCRLLGGEINFDSEVGKGSSFYVTLPWQAPAPTSSVSAKVDEVTQSANAPASASRW